MPDQDALKRNIIGGFINVLRTSPLNGRVDTQEVMLFLDRLLSSGDVSTLDLGPLHTFLMDKGCPSDAVSQALLFFHSRQARFGVHMVLPPSIEAIGSADREALIGQLTNQGITSGTYARSSTRDTKKPEKLGTGTTGKMKKIGPEALGVETTASVPRPKKQGGISTGVKLFAGLGVVAMLGVYGVMRANDTPPAEQLVVKAEDGLPCARVEKRGASSAVCYIEPGALQNADVAREQQAATLTALKAMGVKSLFLLHHESGALLSIPK